MSTADYYIAKLGMTQHVEGGAFKEHYRAPMLLPRSVLSATPARPSTSYSGMASSAPFICWAVILRAVNSSPW